MMATDWVHGQGWLSASFASISYSGGYHGPRNAGLAVQTLRSGEMPYDACQAAYICRSAAANSTR